MTTRERLTVTMNAVRTPIGLWIVSLGLLALFGTLIFRHPPEGGVHAWLEYGGFGVGILANPMLAWAIGKSIGYIAGPAIAAWRAFRGKNGNGSPPAPSSFDFKGPLTPGDDT